MSNEDLFTDLKQFIEATVSQSEQRFERHMDAKIDDLRSDISGQFDEVLDAIGERADNADRKLEDHERRLTRLEHRAA